jgi:thiamine-monophosphate kinase
MDPLPADRLRCGPGSELVLALDTLVAGVHFPEDTAAFDLGWKAAAVNLSDLAAMGARPRLLAATVVAPHRRLDPDGVWMTALRAGLAQAGALAGARVGEVVVQPGALVISVEARGEVPAGMALRRDGARRDDAILVTGTLGDAGLGLACVEGRARPPHPARHHLVTRLTRPTPRTEAGESLRGIASAAIDISDGLVRDLGHILTASGMGAQVDVERLPLSPALTESLPRADAQRLALCAGDDYELCFTVPEDRLAALETAVAHLGCPVTRIGRIEAAPGLRLVDGRGQPFAAGAGYEHFGEAGA